MNTTLRYETTGADQLAKLDRYVAGSTVGRSFTRFAYFAIVGLAWFSAVLFYVKQGDRNLTYLFSGGFAAVLTVALPWLYGRYQAAFWQSVLTADALRGVIGPTTLIVSDQGIEELGPVTTVRAEWRRVLRVDSSPERTFVVIAPLIAIAVPASAFSGAGDRFAFERMVDERRVAALQTPVD